MAITTMDGIVAGLSTSRNMMYYTPSSSTTASGWTNIARASVTSFGQQAVPAVSSSGGTLHTSAEVGFPSLPTPTGVRYLAKVEMTGTQSGSLHLYDRVWSCSGFSGTVATAQSVTGFPTLVRPDANGTGLELWIECYSATGASAVNISVQYTNSAGNSGRNTVTTAHPTSMAANRLYPVPLQSGDTGVQSVQSVTLSATTGTSGNFGVTLMDRIATIPIMTANLPNVLDFASLGFPAIADGAAISGIHQSSSNTSGIILGNLIFIEG